MHHALLNEWGRLLTRYSTVGDHLEEPESA
jgi:hypothetical protein